MGFFNRPNFCTAIKLLGVALLCSVTLLSFYLRETIAEKFVI